MTAGTPDRYRLLLARLETARTRALESARLAAHEETALVASGIASGYLHAIADCVRVFEGPEVAQAYMDRAAAVESTAAISPPPA